jgi:hypothetical protein
MTACRSRVEPINASRSKRSIRSKVQALTSVLPRVAGEDEGGGLNGLNFLNELNYAEGVAYCLRSGGLVPRPLSHANNPG